MADFNTYKTSEIYNGLFGGFIWSHIPLEALPQFLKTVNHLAAKDSTIIFIDNNYVEGSSTAISNTDENNNTWQTRKLQDGSSHLVLKNFPSEQFIRNLLAGVAEEIEFVSLQYFWMVSYTPVQVYKN